MASTSKTHRIRWKTRTVNTERSPESENGERVTTIESAY